jgi:hypothetical protein
VLWHSSNLLSHKVLKVPTPNNFESPIGCQLVLSVAELVGGGVWKNQSRGVCAWLLVLVLVSAVSVGAGGVVTVTAGVGDALALSSIVQSAACVRVCAKRVCAA